MGSIEVDSVPDAVGLLAGYSEAYPEVPAESWGPHHTLYPELFAGESWRLPCNSFLVRSQGTTILVDTGVGPPGLWEDWTPEREGELPDALAELGVARDDVDVVFLTHLHIDHLGWNADRDGVPFFPRARYLVHRDALAFARTHREWAHIRRCVEALADRFETFDRDLEIAPGVTTLELRGHYPGHTGLRVVDGGAEAVLIADTAVHPALLDNPDWLYVSDGDPPACADTRRALLGELADRDVLVACGHYPGSGIGHVVARDGRVVWEKTT